jgi:antitoxin component YwqK of YwqJK toxin-antitoxin module
MSSLRKHKKKVNLVFLSFFILLFNYCSDIEIKESELKSCISLVHSNGQTILNGELFTGSCLVYNNEGEMMSLLSYKNGIPHGIHKGYYPNGDVEYEGYRKKKEIHGDYIKYYPGGGIEMTGQFRRGIYQGKWKYFDIDGNISMEKTYIRGNVIDSIIK